MLVEGLMLGRPAAFAPENAVCVPEALNLAARANKNLTPPTRGSHWLESERCRCSNESI